MNSIRATGKRDVGSWGDPPAAIVEAWATLVERFDRITAKYPRFKNTNNLIHLGTLGTGNHFIELCLDTEQRVCAERASSRRCSPARPTCSISAGPSDCSTRRSAWPAG